MRDSKRKRLEAKGWRIGSAQDFLGLSEDESSYVELKLSLADCLRDLRRKRGLAQTEVAKLCRSSQSRVAKMESADESVSLDLMIRALFALGATTPELTRMLSRAPMKVSERDA